MRMNSRRCAGASALLLCILTACSAPDKAKDTDSQVLRSERSAFDVSRALPRAGEGHLTAELEARIEALIADFAINGPATVENASGRAMTLYDWGNAMKLDGQWVHPDLPSLTTIIQQPDFSNTNPRVLVRYLAGIDNFTREFILRRAQPNAFGDLSLKVLKPAVVNDFHSVETTYTVGTEPIRPGGGVVVPNHMRFADFEYQTSDPTKPNYVTIRSSNDLAVFETSAYPAAGQYATSLHVGLSARLAFILSEGELTEGDTVTITFGDMSGGSPGLQTVHYSNSAMRYPVWIATGAPEEGGILHSLPELPVELLGGPATGVQGFAPAMADVDEEIEVTIRTEDRFRNRAETNIPAAYDVLLNGKAFRTIQTAGKSLVRLPVTFSEEGVYRLSYRSSDGTITGVSSPILVEKDLKKRVFWGETHGHSGWAEGLGLADNYFEFAREESRLDFVTLSEHDLWMDLSEWSEMRKAVDKHFRDGKFMTFMGYEWTSLPQFGGHHNVLFRDPETAILAGTQYFPALDQLYAALRVGVSDEDVIVIPHAHMPGDWTKSDPGLERLVEIVSYHGTFEWFGKRYLNEGWEVGFIGSSDDHIGSPGYRPRAFGFPASDDFGGLAAVYASELSRDSVFDALRNRQTYATNGARIILTAELNGQEMGTRLPVGSGVRTLSGMVVGTAPIEEITLIKNGIDLETRDFAARGGEAGNAPVLLELAMEFDSDPRSHKPKYPDAIYRGQVRFGNAAATAARAPVSEALNRETEYVTLSEDGRSAEFRLKSGGRRVTMQFEFPRQAMAIGEVSIDLSGSVLPFFKPEAIPQVVLALKDLEAEAYELSLDGDRAFHLLQARLIRPVSEMEHEFEFRDTSVPQAGDYYYLRVRQSDGGIAWSSPWWVGKPMRREQQ